MMHEFTVITEKHGVIRCRARTTAHMLRAFRQAGVRWMGWSMDEERDERDA